MSLHRALRNYIHSLRMLRLCRFFPDLLWSSISTRLFAEREISFYNSEQNGQSSFLWLADCACNEEQRYSIEALWSI